ncbi:hypothetical protein PACILC2_53270 [Paenibacillus cisolokensis]|uniref:AMP-dependent synthetase/ligase domain-containing protein n=1 Tax=Paenibacillus cisolokensis TaxID=1658519 RepID=A0ABQ4NEY8_9BACL|nr:AMP-binding protein [Paenibacillus cisolokensis]GIQ66759.1 hypothetical protein PACILC2_53270 [Paenibacillus cisolokensis]
MTDNDRERERKFKDLLARIRKSPLYKEKLSEYNLNGIGLDHIQTLPLTTKEDLRKAGAFGHLAVEMKEVAQYHESTGTTGEPSSSWFTQEDLRTGGRQLKDCGVRLTAEDLVLIRFPYAMALPAFLMQQAAWQSGAGVVPASGRTVVTPYPRVLQLMERLRVTVAAGLPREFELLAETARLIGSTPSNHFPALRAICVAGELMSDKRREHIEKLWGVPVFNMYGSTETANIATMCENGVMHIVEQDFTSKCCMKTVQATWPKEREGLRRLQRFPIKDLLCCDILMKTLSLSNIPCVLAAEREASWRITAGVRIESVLVIPSWTLRTSKKPYIHCLLLRMPGRRFGKRTGCTFCLIRMIPGNGRRRRSVLIYPGSCMCLSR